MFEPLLLILVGALLCAAGMLVHRHLASFRAQTPQDYDGLGPEFDMRRHLSGPILCEGVIFGPTGRVTSRFVAEMQGTWTGNRGVLAETFRYDSGAVQRREWRVALSGDGTFTAEADDIVGQGMGRHVGPALNITYSIRLPEDAGGHVLQTTDWMYLVQNGTIMNRSQFRKHGIVVAELMATLRPNPDPGASAPAAPCLSEAPKG